MNKTNDRGYDKRQSGEFTPGRAVVLLEDTYYGHPWNAGTVGTLISLSNAGFRGIEAAVRVGDELIVANLDVIGLAL